MIEQITGASHSVYRSHPKEVTALMEHTALRAADPALANVPDPVTSLS